MILSGAGKGKSLPVREIVGNTAVLGVVDPKVLAQLKPGDEVQVDNSNFLAAQTYQRHQDPGPQFAVWDQYRSADGKPLYPQRPKLLGPLFTMGAAGTIPTGAFSGKVILVESLWDREAFPWKADWYRQRVKEHFRARTDEHFRLWYVDHALHGAPDDANRTVSYVPMLQQALKDVAAWVEKGVAPPATTNYRVEGGQVIVPAKAAERRGIQPVVTLQVNGGTRAEVKAGEPVTFSGTIEVPPGLLGRGEHYALEVEGDSMTDAGIVDGDTVIIEKCESADNGSIIVALVEENEVTLKRLRRRGNSIALEPANPRYETRIFGPDRVKVQGRLVALFRRY